MPSIHRRVRNDQVDLGRVEHTVPSQRYIDTGGNSLVEGVPFREVLKRFLVENTRLCPELERSLADGKPGAPKSEDSDSFPGHITLARTLGEPGATGGVLGPFIE